MEEADKPTTMASINVVYVTNDEFRQSVANPSRKFITPTHVSTFMENKPINEGMMKMLNNHLWSKDKLGIIRKN